MRACLLSSSIHCVTPTPARAPQVDGALKGAATVSEVLDATLPILLPDTLDALPKPLRRLPPRLQHFAVELPPTPEWLGEGGAPGSSGEGSDGSEAPPGEQQEQSAAVAVA